MTEAEAAPTAQVGPGLFRIELGFVSAYLVVEGEELILVDAGFPPDAGPILAAIERLGLDPGALSRIVLTHAHPDHFGSAAELRRRTGARIMLAEQDAAQVRRGFSGFAPLIPQPGFEALVEAQVTDPAYLRKMDGFTGAFPLPIEPFPIDEEMQVGGAVAGLGGSRLIAAPGHQAAQVAILLERQGGVLFAGDGAVNFSGPAIAPVAEDFEASRQTFRRLAELEFEIACFGHGEPLLGGAAAAFRASLA